MLDTTIRKKTQITLIRHEPSYKQLEGTLRDFKNCVTDNMFWAKLLYFGVFVKEIMQATLFKSLHWKIEQ